MWISGYFRNTFFDVHKFFNNADKVAAARWNNQHYSYINLGDRVAQHVGEYYHSPLGLFYKMKKKRIGISFYYASVLRYQQQLKKLVYHKFRHWYVFASRILLFYYSRKLPQMRASRICAGILRRRTKKMIHSRVRFFVPTNTTACLTTELVALLKNKINKNKKIVYNNVEGEPLVFILSTVRRSYAVRKLFLLRRSTLRFFWLFARKRINVRIRSFSRRACLRTIKNMQPRYVRSRSVLKKVRIHRSSHLHPVSAQKAVTRMDLALLTNILRIRRMLRRYFFGMSTLIINKLYKFMFNLITVPAGVSNYRQLLNIKSQYRRQVIRQRRNVRALVRGGTPQHRHALTTTKETRGLRRLLSVKKKRIARIYNIFRQRRQRKSEHAYILHPSAKSIRNIKRGVRTYASIGERYPKIAFKNRQRIATWRKLTHTKSTRRRYKYRNIRNFEKKKQHFSAGKKMMRRFNKKWGTWRMAVARRQRDWLRRHFHLKRARYHIESRVFGEIEAFSGVLSRTLEMHMVDVYKIYLKLTKKSAVQRLSIFFYLLSRRLDMYLRKYFPYTRLSNIRVFIKRGVFFVNGRCVVDIDYILDTCDVISIAYNIVRKNDSTVSFDCIYTYSFTLLFFAFFSTGRTALRQFIKQRMYQLVYGVFRYYLLTITATYYYIHPIFYIQRIQLYNSFNTFYNILPYSSTYTQLIRNINIRAYNTSCIDWYAFYLRMNNIVIQPQVRYIDAIMSVMAMDYITDAVTKLRSGLGRAWRKQRRYKYRYRHRRIFYYRNRHVFQRHRTKYWLRNLNIRTRANVYSFGLLRKYIKLRNLINKVPRGWLFTAKYALAVLLQKYRQSILLSKRQRLSVYMYRKYWRRIFMKYYSARVVYNAFKRTFDVQPFTRELHKTLYITMLTQHIVKRIKQKASFLHYKKGSRDIKNRQRNLMRQYVNVLPKNARMTKHSGVFLQQKKYKQDKHVVSHNDRSAHFVFARSIRLVNYVIKNIANYNKLIFVSPLKKIQQTHRLLTILARIRFFLRVYKQSLYTNTIKSSWSATYMRELSFYRIIKRDNYIIYCVYKKLLTLLSRGYFLIRKYISYVRTFLRKYRASSPYQLPDEHTEHSRTIREQYYKDVHGYVPIPLRIRIPELFSCTENKLLHCASMYEKSAIVSFIKDICNVVNVLVFDALYGIRMEVYVNASYIKYVNLWLYRWAMHIYFGIVGAYAFDDEDEENLLSRHKAMRDWSIRTRRTTAVSAIWERVLDNFFIVLQLYLPTMDYLVIQEGNYSILVQGVFQILARILRTGTGYTIPLRGNARHNSRMFRHLVQNRANVRRTVRNSIFVADKHRTFDMRRDTYLSYTNAYAR